MWNRKHTLADTEGVSRGRSYERTMSASQHWLIEKQRPLDDGAQWASAEQSWRSVLARRSTMVAPGEGERTWM
jgi:hypothetical protein